MDFVTGTGVAVTVTVPLPPERMWDLVTAVDRIGEWSPEALGGAWCDGADGATPGARFHGRNRFPNGFDSTVTCVVIEAERPGTFAWTVLDDDGLVGSMWRYDLRDGTEPGSTLVHHAFTHGAGNTGAREDAVADPGSLDRRLTQLCRNMTTTIAAMTLTTGVTR